jgi:hypothetical protein
VNNKLGIETIFGLFKNYDRRTGILIQHRIHVPAEFARKLQYLKKNRIGGGRLLLAMMDVMWQGLSNHCLKQTCSGSISNHCIVSGKLFRVEDQEQQLGMKGQASTLNENNWDSAKKSSCLPELATLRMRLASLHAAGPMNVLARAAAIPAVWMFCPSNWHCKQCVQMEATNAATLRAITFGVMTTVNAGCEMLANTEAQTG